MPSLADKARKLFTKIESFDAQIARLEQDARAFLGDENCPPAMRSNDEEPGTEAWVKFEFLSGLGRIRTAIDQNEPALVFDLSLGLGALLERFDVITAYKMDIIRGAKVGRGAAEGGKKNTTRERDRLLAIEWRERRAKALAIVSDTALKVAVGRESEFELKPETAKKAINRGLRLLEKETR